MRRGRVDVYMTVRRIAADFDAHRVPDTVLYDRLPPQLRHLWRVAWLMTDNDPCDDGVQAAEGDPVSDLERAVATAVVLTSGTVRRIKASIAASDGGTLRGRVMYVTTMLGYVHAWCCAPARPPPRPALNPLSIFSIRSLSRVVQVPELRTAALDVRWRMELRAGEAVLADQHGSASGHRLSRLERIEVLRPSKVVADVISQMTYATLDAIMVDPCARDALCVAAFAARAHSAVPGFAWHTRCLWMAGDLETYVDASSAARTARIHPVLVYRLGRWDLFRSGAAHSYVSYTNAVAAITAWRDALFVDHQDCIDGIHRWSGILEVPVPGDSTR